MSFRGTNKFKSLGVCLVILLLFLLLLYMLPDVPSMDEPSINLKNLLLFAIRAAEEGGESVRLQVISFNKINKGKTREGADEYVTDADYKSHCIMYHVLHSHFPFTSIISEETISLLDCERRQFLESKNTSFTQNKEIERLNDIYVSNSDVTVWIDPLDATQEFTENLTRYVTTMVCVAVKGKPVIGVIQQPFDRITSWAWMPFGVSSDLHNPPKNVNLNNPIITVSRSHAGQIQKMAKKVFPKATVIPAGGAGYKVLQLIKGNASVYLHETAIKKWDICAGDAVLRVVGGRVSTLFNETIDYSFNTDVVNKDGILASATGHDKFYEKFKFISKAV